MFQVQLTARTPVDRIQTVNAHSSSAFINRYLDPLDWSKYYIQNKMQLLMWPSSVKNAPIIWSWTRRLSNALSDPVIQITHQYFHLFQTLAVMEMKAINVTAVHLNTVRQTAKDCTGSDLARKHRIHWRKKSTLQNHWLSDTSDYVA